MVSRKASSSTFRGIDRQYRFCFDSGSDGNFMTRSPSEALVLINNAVTSLTTQDIDSSRRKLVEVSTVNKEYHDSLAVTSYIQAHPPPVAKSTTEAMLEELLGLLKTDIPQLRTDIRKLQESASTKESINAVELLSGQKQHLFERPSPRNNYRSLLLQRNLSMQLNYEFVEVEENRVDFDSAGEVSTDTDQCVDRHHLGVDRHQHQTDKPVLTFDRVGSIQTLVSTDTHLVTAPICLESPPVTGQVYTPQVPCPLPRLSKQEIPEERCMGIVDKILLHLPPVDIEKLSPPLQSALILDDASETQDDKKLIVPISELVNDINPSRILEKV
ncbi:unnamed protein product, partial [Arabidopsis halleri]